MRVSGAIVRAWWRMQLPLEVRFLGFGRDMPWSMSVVLASSGEAWICADLIGRGTDCLGLEDLDTAGSHGGCEMLWSLDPADKHV